jgi:hypothetical protein
VIEEWNASIEPERHSHIVDALDRIVDEHGPRIEAQCLIDRARGT